MYFLIVRILSARANEHPQVRVGGITGSYTIKGGSNLGLCRLFYVTDAYFILLN